MRKVRFLGLDVHAATIAVAVAEPRGEVRSLGTIPNRPESIRKLVKKLGAVDALRVLAPSTVGDVNVSPCKKGASATFGTQRRSQAPFWL